jgi:phage tail sheath protein FI
MSRIPFGGLGALVALFIPPCLLASLVSPLDVAALADASDLIVVGRVSHPHSVGSATVYVGQQPVSAIRIIAEVAVSRVIKGSLDTGSAAIEYRLPQAPIGYGTPSVDATEMLFLRRTSGGRLLISDPYHPELVAGERCDSDPPGPGSSTRSEVLGRITAELSCVTLDETAQPAVRTRAIAALGSINSAEATTVMKSAAESPDLVVRSAALTALLRQHDTSRFDEVASILMNPAIPERARGPLADAVDGTGDPKTVPALEHLLDSQDAYVRRAAASALRNTHSQASIGGLGKAIEDSDSWVRYQGVVGLGEITRQDEWTPATDIFAADEQKFLTHWREWLSTHGR